jgi:hypothetical protein
MARYYLSIVIESANFIFIPIPSVEDHDDLVPIFNRQSDMLKSTYGDYFLAELIEAQDENMKCIVAEVSACIFSRHTIIKCLLIARLMEQRLDS